MTLYSITECGTKGLGLTATQDIEAGTVISVQKPLVSIATDTTICFYCFNQAYLQCKQCSNRFCKTCFGQHTEICPLLAYIYKNAAKNNRTPGPCLIMTIYTIYNKIDISVWSSTTFERNCKDEGSFALANIVRDALGNFGVEKPLSDIIRVISSVSENAFKINGETKQYGVALYDKPITKVNHSCNPNCKFKFKLNVATLESSKDILKGKQLLISYTDLDVPRKDRQKVLLEQYGFHCKCLYCHGAKAEYREAIFRFNFCPRTRCQDPERFKAFKMPADDIKVPCRLSFQINSTEDMPKSVASRLGLLKVAGNNVECYRCGTIFDNSKLNECEALLEDGIPKQLLYECISFIRNWVHPQNLAFKHWLGILQQPQ